jgi:hypothetical protein
VSNARVGGRCTTRLNFFPISTCDLDVEDREPDGTIRHASTSANMYPLDIHWRRVCCRWARNGPRICLYRMLGRRPQPVLVTITACRLRSNPGYAMEYSFEGEHAGRRFAHKQRMKVLNGQHGVRADQWTYEEPIFVSQDSTQALAIANDLGRARLLKTNFRPLELAEDEKHRVLSA